MEKGKACGDYVKQIKGALAVKSVKGKDYYYIRVRLKFALPGGKKGIDREAYVCPVSAPDAILPYYFCLARGKLVRDIYSYLCGLSQKAYKSRIISGEEMKNLELIRLAYNMHLKGFGETEAKRYEEAAYTKYVHGTTSIEGNTYTLRETDLTLNEGVTIGGKEKREFYEIENYARLKRELPAISRIKIDIPLIKKIHSILMANIDDDAVGEFRRVDVGIRGSEFTPPLSFEVEQKMDKLIAWHKENESKIHPIELASVFHQKFGEIHPFVDGNGRVGRELVRLILAINGYPTIYVNKPNREEYLKAMDEGNSGNYKPLVKFFMRNLEGVHKELLERAKLSLGAGVIADCSKCFLSAKCDESIRKLSKEFGASKF